ncbi:polysaccharide pyruvyl transferase family protein [Erwinia sp. S43]|uniref:polysaccharide pyruvyl transferase family protein n=1 Tax=Erwinia sp. S43 TaxID=2769339 RepID=UPI00190CCBC5|nr:polysaccharide pyruvyl transferase family protein [Erwinia sp. S43]MBK0033754.1 polysaccharide pyruvyl transferase family protein [Erwinia sp. S43]
MKVEYFNSKLNFGDELNSWLWDYFLGDTKNISDCDYFVPVGSLLCDWFLERVGDKKTVIFSSGAGYGDVADLKKENIKIIGVRGTLTAQTLGLDESLAIGDGAALISLVPELKNSENLENEIKPVIFIPHHESLDDFDWESICNAAGIMFVDPRNTSKYVADKIINSKLVIAEAMHAAIFSDALRVPWVPIVTTHRINTFKWMDWLSMYNLKYSPTYIGSPSLILEIENKIRISTNTSLFNKNNDLSFYKDNVFNGSNFNLKRKICAASCMVLRSLHNISPKSKGLRSSVVIKSMIDAKNQAGNLSEDEVFLKRVAVIHNKLLGLKP